MGRNLRKENPDGFYEINVLKNDEAEYFCCDEDFEYFYNLLKKQKTASKIIAYALYTDRVDIVVKEENYTNISTFVGNVLRLYSSYYKKKYSYEKKVFKSRYRLCNIKKENLTDAVLTLHNRFLKESWDKKDNYIYSSLPEYFLKKEFCDVNIIYDKISQKDFYIMQYNEENFKNEDLETYICRIAGIENIDEIKNIFKDVRDYIIEDLYYNKKIGPEKIGELFSLTRQGVYFILKKRQKETK